MVLKDWKELSPQEKTPRAIYESIKKELEAKPLNESLAAPTPPTEKKGVKKGKK